YCVVRKDFLAIVSRDTVDRPSGLSSVEFPFGILQQSEIDNFADRDLANIFFHSADQIEMNLQLLFTDNAVVVERLDDGLIRTFGNPTVDFPFSLDDIDGAGGIFLRIAKTAIERPYDLLYFLWMFLNALIRGAIAVACEFYHIADEGDF